MEKNYRERSTGNSWKYLTTLAVTVGVIALVTAVFTSQKEKRPHILLILADDLGWNDISWNNPRVKTPHLHKLASEGVIFNQTYVQPLCSPTRAALLTGYYPFRIGMQHKMLWRSQRGGLPLELRILPEKLKEVGYLTHMVGKWHLGHSSWDYTPLKRGFDSFYGHYGGIISHYEKTAEDAGMIKKGAGDIGAKVVGYDLRDGTGVVQKDDKAYSTLLYTERAVDIISKHYAEYPLFLYFAIDQPSKGLQVPSHYEDLYPDIENQNVRKYYGKLSLLDEGIANVTSALKSRGMWDNTMLIFISDNGAFTFTQGCNLPFRSTATTIFEGATRVPAMIHGPLLKRTGYVNNGLNHITDWHSTLLSIAGIKQGSDLDGMDILDMITNGSPSPRKEFIYNIDQFEKSPGAAIRVGDWKLIVGNPNIMYPGQLLSEVDHWFPVDKTMFKPKGTMGMEAPTPPANLTLLFNLTDDPEERNDLSNQLPDKVDELRRRLDEYRKQVAPHVDLTLDPAAHPDNFDGVFSPWL
ncbi:arylsulfatase B-like [Ptychodera flava]|uniref:arylsulfatase B-like n=1 Tax=Ptychodera flava TaxID=63121 RepID=UPI00396A25C9